MELQSHLFVCVSSEEKNGVADQLKKWLPSRAKEVGLHKTFTYVVSNPSLMSELQISTLKIHLCQDRKVSYRGSSVSKNS